MFNEARWAIAHLAFFIHIDTIVNNKHSELPRLKVLMKKQQIESRLRTALLHGEKMEYSLYEYELQEHIDYWHKGLIADREDCVFAVTENTGHVAMVLILPDKTVLVNEDAKAKLIEFWKANYRNNMERFIPVMAQELADGIIAVTGVKVVDRKLPKKWRWGQTNN